LLHPAKSAHVFIGNTIVVTSGVATTYPTGSHELLPILLDHMSYYLSYRITWVYSTTYPTGSPEQQPILPDHMSLLLGFVWFVLS